MLKNIYKLFRVRLFWVNSFIHQRIFFLLHLVLFIMYLVVCLKVLGILSLTYSSYQFNSWSHSVVRDTYDHHHNKIRR